MENLKKGSFGAFFGRHKNVIRIFMAIIAINLLVLIANQRLAIHINIVMNNGLPENENSSDTANQINSLTLSALANTPKNNDLSDTTTQLNSLNSHFSTVMYSTTNMPPITTSTLIHLKTDAKIKVVSKRIDQFKLNHEQLIKKLSPKKFCYVGRIGKFLKYIISRTEKIK
jgi:hypothetical protein